MRGSSAGLGQMEHLPQTKGLAREDLLTSGQEEVLKTPKAFFDTTVGQNPFLPISQAIGEDWEKWVAQE